MVQREANTITNEVRVRAWPGSMQSAHFPRGECLASCAVSQSARGSAAKNQGNGRWMRHRSRGAVPRQGRVLCVVFAKGPARRCSGERCECGGARGKTEIPGCFLHASCTPSCQDHLQGVWQAGTGELIPQEQPLPPGARRRSVVGAAGRTRAGFGNRRSKRADSISSVPAKLWKGGMGKGRRQRQKEK